MSFFSSSAAMLQPESDELLVSRCLAGDEEAWSALIGKYKNLIFSIPVKYGFRPEDATDIFQSVCLSLLSELRNLREPKALAAWLIRLTAHKCGRWKRERQRYIAGDSLDQSAPPDEEPLPDRLIAEVEEEQMVREAVAELSPDCRRLVELLFLSDPPLRYDEAAASLGLATGSIGATRMRCLEKLKRSLVRKGLRTPLDG